MMREYSTHGGTKRHSNNGYHVEKFESRRWNATRHKTNILQSIVIQRSDSHN